MRARVAIGVLAAAASASLLAAPASAQLGSVLFGKPGSKKISADTFEVTARGNNIRERRSSLTMALLKAARRAEKARMGWIAVVREKTGTWSMNGRAIGDETTIRVVMMAEQRPTLDTKGAPARVYSVAELLSHAP
jgi:hypothetical protein